MFAGGDVAGVRFGPNTLMVLNQGEAYAIRAPDEDLVFVALLHGSPGSE